MSFYSTARIVMPLVQMSESVIPLLSAEGGTNYGAAFSLLGEAIEHDTAIFKEQGYKVYRPCVFFLVDGKPTDHDWYETFTRTLTYDRATGRGMKAYPIFVPFGFRDASEDVLRKLAYPPERGKWYHANNVNIDDALKGIIDIIVKSIIASGYSMPSTIVPSNWQSTSEYNSDYLT